MFKTVYHDVFSIVQSKYPGRVAIIFRQQIQPWHPSSTLTHEAGAAVLKLSPDHFWDFSDKLFDQQTDFYDVSVVHETRNDTYKRLAKVAGAAGVDETAFYDVLKISDKPGEDGALNIGNGVTNDLKLMVKANRLVGVHVTPTVIFNVGVHLPSKEPN